MNRCLLLTVPLLLLLISAADARTIVVTDTNRETSVTLAPGDTLVVRLAANPTTGYSWNVVFDPDAPLALSGKPRYRPTPHPPLVVGSGGTQEFRFTAGRATNSTQGGWLRLLSLRPFEPSVKDAPLWEVHYTVKAAK